MVLAVLCFSVKPAMLSFVARLRVNVAPPRPWRHMPCRVLLFVLYLDPGGRYQEGRDKPTSLGLLVREVNQGGETANDHAWSWRCSRDPRVIIFVHRLGFQHGPLDYDSNAEECLGSASIYSHHLTVSWFVCPLKPFTFDIQVWGLRETIGTVSGQNPSLRAPPRLATGIRDVSLQLHVPPRQSRWKQILVSCTAIFLQRQTP